jgi:hypothetical protein
LNAVERLAPNSQWSYFLPKWRSIAHLQAGRLEQALEAAAQSLDVFPDSDALIQSMLCWAKSNDWKRACDTMRRLRDADREMSRALVESFVRDLYCGSHAVDEYVATARKIWNEVSSESQ